jgi:hypothetical protein
VVELSFYKSGATLQIKDEMQLIDFEIETLASMCDSVREVLKNGYVIGCGLEYEDRMLKVHDGVLYLDNKRYIVNTQQFKVNLSTGDYVYIDKTGKVKASQSKSGVLLARYTGTFDYSVRSRIVSDDVIREPGNLKGAYATVVDTYAELPAEIDTMFAFVRDESRLYLYNNGSYTKISYASIMQGGN